ncbi:MAG: acetyl-CoA carboxylase biotin carboxyl carrier protein subunit [Armatimonadetes bacterium]|nr:acetyl-CoA carboxylase biotin carboxyl carrier protein subunit [Armatimonadota bacterium]
MTTDPLSPITPDDVRRLSALLEKHDLTELRYENGDVRVTLRTAEFFAGRVQTTVAVAASPAMANAEAAPDLANDESLLPEVADTPGVRIEAPIMGVFYRTASPGDPPLVEVGDSVEVGQVVGLIEAMKVFSEIKSEVAGIVRSIPALNKALVQPGDALILLDVA